MDAAPTDLTEGPDGTLYASSATSSALFRIDGASAERLPMEWPRAYGLTTTASGRLCLAHYTSEDALTRQSAVSCRDGDVWSVEVTGIGSGINGLAGTSDGIWAIGWRDTAVEQRDGLLSLIVEGAVQRSIELPELFPQFAVALPSGDLLVSAWREDASGFRDGTLLRVGSDGAVESFGSGLERPSGLALAGDGVWVADHAAGAVVHLSHDGTELERYTELSEPLGLAALDEDRFCVAESERSRITCLDREDLSGGSP